jgi:membrane-associated phospholipid phosphatase
MDNLLEEGVQFILWLQSLGDWLTPIMKVFTFLGDAEFYLLIAPAILWCVDGPLGLRVGLFLMVNGMVNSAIKVGFHGSRPYWYSREIKVFDIFENSFGTPSGHAQNSVVVWGTLAQRIKGHKAWSITILLMFMIGISRMYLGVHFPHDVLLGWIIGIVMLWLFLRLERPVVSWIKKYPMGVQILISFLFSLVLIFIVVIAMLSLGGWSVPTEWIDNAQFAFPEEPSITPLSFHNFLTSAGAFFGLTAGWIWISHRGGFSTIGEWWKLVLRYLVGLVGVLVLYLGLGSLFPDTETLLAFALRYIRYALIGFWMAGIAPWLFVRLRLARVSTSHTREKILLQ